jgi:hypothetical protein
MQERENRMKTEVYGLIDTAVMSAVLELASGRAKVAELKFESGDEVLWIVLTDRRAEQLACFTARTIDQDTLVGIGPTFLAKESRPADLHAAVCTFLSQQIAGAGSLSAALFTGAGISTSLLMKGDSTDGVMHPVQKETAVRWEPVGPSGFGC